jgi:uncharacterized protein (DUF2062 family)
VKKYISSVAIGLFSLLLLPVFGIVMLLATDSCCGIESENVFAVSVIFIVVTVIHLVIAIFFNFLVSAFILKDLKRDDKIMQVVISTLIPTAPYALFVLFVFGSYLST